MIRCSRAREDLVVSNKHRMGQHVLHTWYFFHITFYYCAGFLKLFANRYKGDLSLEVVKMSFAQLVNQQVCLHRADALLHLAVWRRARQAILVGSVDTDWALIVVLEELEVGVVGRCHAGNTSTSADEAWADINRVCEARLHVDRWECWEETRLRLVVVCCRGVGAAAWVVALEEERTVTRVGV